MPATRVRGFVRRALGIAAIAAAAASCASAGHEPKTFTDEDLAALLRTSACGLIAVVSPEMPLSISNLRNLGRIAEMYALALTVLVDPRSDERAVRDLADRFPRGGEPLRNESRTLGLHGTLLHYPSVHVFIDGRLDARVIYGAKSIEAYEDFLSQLAASTASSRAASDDARCVGVARLRQNGTRLSAASGAQSGADETRFDPSALPVSPRWRRTGERSIERVPKYFFKPMSKGSWIAYQAGFSNYLLDLVSGREIEVPGTIDPVPSPDGRLLTVPSVLAALGVGGLHFMRLSDLMAGRSRDDALVFTDDEIPGTYQSVGMRTDGAKTIYRVVSESLYIRKGVYFQDYELIEHRGQISGLRPHTRSQRRLCPSLSFALPSLSKTGKIFSGVDPIHRNTKVFAIDEAGACALRAELPYPTSKADISFDDRLMAFHMSPIDSRSVTEVMRRPGPELRLDAYVYDLETHELERVTNCREANCFYPSFRESGELVYLQQDLRDGSYRFVTMTRAPNEPQLRSRQRRIPTRRP